MADGLPEILLLDCMYLLSPPLSQEGNISAVQHVVGSGLLPLMINKYTSSTQAPGIISAVITGVGLIVKNGPITVTETLVELGFVQKLVHLLSEQHGRFALTSIAV